MQLIIPGVHGNGQVYLDILKAICGETEGKSMADLMCYHAPYTPLLGFAERTYVDVQDRGLDHKEEQQFFIKADVFEFFIKNEGKTYDFMICSDAIEHITKEQGEDLQILMEGHSKKPVFFTPLGEWMITDDNNPDSHKSGWLPEDFPGYATIILPDFHPTLDKGAFFAFKCENIQQEFERVINELKIKSWIKSL